MTIYPDGCSIKTDWDKVDEIKNIIDKTLKKHKFMTVDCLTALCILSIELSCNGKISKPHFLCKISQWYEEMENQMNG